MRHVSRTHRVALDWLFDRINLDTKIQIKYIDTKNQLADILTKGNFTRDEWNHLLNSFNISHFSSTTPTFRSVIRSPSFGSHDRAQQARRGSPWYCGRRFSASGRPHTGPTVFPSNIEGNFPFQIALSTRERTEAVTHALQALTSLHEDATVVSIDGVTSSLGTPWFRVDGNGTR